MPITFHDQKGTAFNRQKEYQNGTPFTANPYIGCLVGCRYCYIQGAPFKYHAEFGKEIKVKTWFPERVDAELQKYNDLPQHLKRVQINEASEYYIPAVLAKMDKELHRDIMAEILSAFKKHWDNGNKWMLHIVTKSPYILRHLPILSSMREMVQVEMTLICLDEEKRRSVESNLFTVNSRFEAIKELSRSGVFVRIMAMPFFGSKDDAVALRETAFEYGAKAFKHKSLNYYDWDRLVRDDRSQIGGREDHIFKDLIVKSGEPFIQDGHQGSVRLLMPNTQWKNAYVGNLEEQEVPRIKFGYSNLNDVDWGYIT